MKQRIVTAAQMKAIEAAGNAHGLSYLQMMENAGLAAYTELTVTFDSYKPLHFAPASAPLCGRVVCADIGIRDEWHPDTFL